MRFTLLLGPPGAGKSTVIQLAKERGISAVDLEDFGHGEGADVRTKKAQEIIRTNRTEDGLMLVGMADVDPVTFPKNSMKVMLLPSFEVYEKRLVDRDKTQEHKRGQGGLEYKYKEFLEWSKKFEHVVHNDDTPEETLKKILAIADYDSV